MIGDIYKKTDKISLYNPSNEVKEFTAIVKKDYEHGDEILSKSYVELNNMTVLERKDRDQRTFNAFVEEGIDDPADSWKWKGTRSKARNKAIALHNEITSGYIIPEFMAQNDEDEEDVMFSDLMRDGVEWMVNNSEYKSSFVQASMGMLVNPVTYMGAEYAEVYQKIKIKQEQGYTVKEIIDEELSGFKAPVYSTDQVLITNAFEQNIQKQRCIFKRRWIDYSEAEAKYGKHENWLFVQPGINTVFNDADGQFYDVKDSDHENLVLETIYLNRRNDTEVPFVGGIYLGDTDVEGNPIRHRDNRDAPKYNIVPFGYQRINEHFFFYKSMTNAQYWDNALIDAQYEIAMNRLFLDTNMPVAVSGQDEFNEDVIFPGATVAFKDKDTKVTPILPPANLANLFAGMNKVEQSMEESSVSDLSAGQLPGGGQTATAVAIANSNAKKMMEGVGRSLAQSMVQFGGLMADVFITHLSVPMIDELEDGEGRMKYRTFVLQDKMVDNKSVTKVLKFDDSLLGSSMSKEQQTAKEMKMLEEIGYPDNKKHLYRINPELFARYKYLCKVEPATMFPMNEEFMQAKLKDIYTLLRQDPYVSAEALVGKLLYANFRGEADGLKAKPQQNAIMGADQTGADTSINGNPGVKAVETVMNKVGK